ncbi:MAG: response regulator [Planctomycetota bacterium]|nr:response regulator [Planctomycetota bacterium]
MRVLLAVEDPVAARIIEAVAQRFGHHVDACAHGSEAARALEEGGYLLAILDAGLPGLTGVELVERIRGRTGGDRPYVLLIAEQDDDERVIQALDAGADDYLVKPIRPAELELRFRLAHKRLSKRIEARERLRSFEELLATSSELIVTAAPDGRVLFANRAWHETMALDEAQDDAFSLHDLVAPDQRDRFDKAYRRVLREQGTARLETAFLTRHGDRVPVEGTLRAKMRGRTPTSVRAHFHDVSRRKRMEAVLRTVLEGTSGATGGDFFRALARHIADSLGARCGLVGELVNADANELRTLAAWDGNAFGTVRTLRLRTEPDPEGGLVPRYLLPPPLLDELGAASYLSVPMTNGRGTVTGLLCVLHDRPVRLGPDALHILTTFAQRAGAELERVKAQRELASRERHAASVAMFQARLLAWDGGWRSLQPILGVIGREADVSRAYLFESHLSEDGAILVSQRAEWCGRGVSSHLDDPDMQDCPLEEAVPDCADELTAGRLFLRSAGEREGWLNDVLEAQGIRSLALAPLFEGARFAGFVGFDDCVNENRFRGGERDLLASVASALSLALERHSAKRRLDSILTSLDDIVWSISARDGSRIYLNPAVERVLGRAPEEFYEKADLWYEIVHADDVERVRALADAVMETGAAEIEYRIIRPDGGVRWIRDRGHVVHDERGRALRLDGVARDVTDEVATKRRTEAFLGLGQRLLEAETPLEVARSIVDAADEMIGWDACWVDLGDPTGPGPMQPVLCMDLVDDARAVVARSAPSVSQGSLLDRLLAEGGLRILRGEPAAENGLAMFGDAGRPARSLLFVPIRSGDRVVGIVSIQSYTPNLYTEADLDTLKSLAAYCAGALSRTEAEQRVRDAERRASAMLDAMPDLVFRLDQVGRYLDFRTADERLLVDPTTAVVGATISDRLPSDVAETWRANIEQALGEQQTQRFEYELDVVGGHRHFEARMAPCSEEEVLVVARDITARRRAEADRLALERGVLETHRLESLGVLAGGIAHDFNNLLTSIMGYASLAQMKTSEETPVHKYLQDIEDATQSAAELAMLMLAYSGKGQFVVQPLDMRDVLSSTEGLLYSELLKLRAIMVSDVPDALPAIEGDQTQLRQVMLNLVLNAAQSMRPDGGIVRIRVGSVTADAATFRGCYVGEDLPAGRYLRIEVADRGCGMSPETIARIFDPFFTTKEEGRGLGLSAVVGIIRGHGAALRVKTRVGGGTTFSLWFPVSAKPIERDAVEMPQVEDVSGALVLVVDDEASVRRLTRDVLESAGYRVLLAEDGVQGSALFEEHKHDVDVVLLDMTMPRMSGEETFRVLQKLRPGVRVLVTSGYTETEAVNRFRGQTPGGFIHKPYRAAELLQKLGDLVAHRGARARS